MKAKKSGFTLIELMTAISIFTIVMVISIGSITNVFDFNRKSRSLKTVMNNMNLSVESMAREMRYGRNYHCGASGTLTAPQDCPAGSNFISFLHSDGNQISYRLNGTSIEKQIGSGAFIQVTAPEIIIDNLVFYTVGAPAGDQLQPKVFIKIRSHAGSGKGRSDLDLETLVSQRASDS